MGIFLSDKISDLYGAEDLLSRGVLRPRICFSNAAGIVGLCVRAETFNLDLRKSNKIYIHRVICKLILLPRVVTNYFKVIKVVRITVFAGSHNWSEDFAESLVQIEVTDFDSERGCDIRSTVTCNSCDVNRRVSLRAE